MKCYYSFKLFWTPMTKLEMITQMVMTCPRPKLSLDSWTILPMFGHKNVYTWWNTALTPYDYFMDDQPIGHDHSQTWINPGFDSSDLNYL